MSADGTPRAPLDSLVGTLLERVTGDVSAPFRPNYDEILALYPLMGTPSVVVRAGSAADVAEAIRFAHVADLPVAVRSGGHTGPTFGTYDNHVVIDLRPLNTVTVDADGVALVGAGATWGEVADALGPHGLALTSGDTASVGVGGLTLGGGFGWLVRKYGLALDRLVGADVVTATGDILHCDAEHNGDLFWALRGGGGNFGVVTRFCFRPFPLRGIVGGTITLGDAGPDGVRLETVLRGWRDAMRTAPEELNSTVMVMPRMGDIPGSTSIEVCYGGSDENAAAAAIAPLLALPGVTANTIAPMEYRDLLQEPEAPDMPVTVVPHNAFAPALTDAAIDALATAQAAIGGVLMLRYLAGAFTRVRADATAFAYRDVESLVISAAFLPVDAAPEAARRVADAWSAFTPHTVGAYGNFSYEPGERTTETLYPPATLARLRTIKRRYDPGNLFRHNHNVVPERG
jgi:FAD/FMN-containing dehydrogenase